MKLTLLFAFGIILSCTSIFVEIGWCADVSEPTDKSLQAALEASTKLRVELSEERAVILISQYRLAFWIQLSNRLQASGSTGGLGIKSIQALAKESKESVVRAKKRSEQIISENQWVADRGFRLSKLAHVSFEEETAQWTLGKQDADAALMKVVFDPEKDANDFKIEMASILSDRLGNRPATSSPILPDNNKSVPELGLSDKAKVSVYFSPNGGTANRIITECGKSQSEILIQAYELTSPIIVDALIAAKVRGVHVFLILDKNLGSENNTDILQRLIRAQINIRIDPADKAHSKTIIIDRNLVITGSYNFSVSAETRNVENALFIQDEVVTKQYFNHWNERWLLATPLELIKP